MVFLLVFTITVLPVSITYFGEGLDTMNSWAVSINSVVEVLFIADIIINFRTGIVSAYATPDYVSRSYCNNACKYFVIITSNKRIVVTQVILDAKEVAKRYLKGWFVVDLISSIPFDQFILIATSGHDAASTSVLKLSQALKILRLAKMLSLLKLLRISRLLRYIQKWENVSIKMASMFLIMPAFSLDIAV